MEEKCVESKLFFNQYRVDYIKYEEWPNGKLIQNELQRFAKRWYRVGEFKLILSPGKYPPMEIKISFMKLQDLN